MDIDAMTGADRPRNRALWAAVAIMVPVVTIGGGAAWFIRGYVMPPTIVIAEPALLASYEPASPFVIPALAAKSATPVAPEPPRPPMMSGVNTSSWPSVSSTQSPPPTYASADPMFNPAGGMNDAGVPIAGPIPLPPPRPRISTAIVRANVPLPRPRPGTEN